MPKIDISWEDKWEYEYGENKIVVRNSFDACQLLINGKVQDAKNGLTLSADLEGELPDGKKVKVSIGGFWTIKCSVFVDHELLKPVK